jgi:ubiquinone biosynthesis protein COQ9
MARKPRRQKTAPAGAPALQLAAAALEEIAALGWRETTVAGAAARAGLDPHQAAILAPTKAALVPWIVDLIDAEALGAARAPDRSVSVRDRLFDLLMRRCDALQKRRAGIRLLIQGLPRDPAAAVGFGCRIGRSMAATLAAAGVSADGPVGCARVLGLKAVMAATMRVWLGDDSADMAKTMAALDRALNVAERAASFVRRPKPKSGSRSSP